MKVKHAKQLNEQDHRTLVVWATDCVEHLLACCEEQEPHDDRPRKAIEAGRAWVRGELPMSAVRAAAFAAHAADHAAARAAARAAGHAAATVHVAGHARHAATYAVAAADAAAPGNAAAVRAAERAWQERRLPEHLRRVVFPAARKS